MPSLQWLDFWSQKLRREITTRNYSKATFENYNQSLRDFLSTNPGSPSRWKKVNIQEFLLALKARGLGAATVNLYFDGLAFFCRHVASNPACVDGFRRMKEDKPLPRVIDAQKIMRANANKIHRNIH